MLELVKVIKEYIQSNIVVYEDISILDTLNLEEARNILAVLSCGKFVTADYGRGPVEQFELPTDESALNFLTHVHEASIYGFTMHFWHDDTEVDRNGNEHPVSHVRVRDVYIDNGRIYKGNKWWIR